MDKRLFFLLNKAQKKLFRHLDRRCEAELDTSATQLAALLYIQRSPGCLQKTLAEDLDLNKSAITGLINRMAANGLVRREIPAHDSRAVALYPTESGSQKVARVKPMIARLNQIYSDAFSEQELATIYRFLNFTIEHF